MRETNVKCADKWNLGSYDGCGVYRNTDENNFVEIIICLTKNNMIQAFSQPMYEELLEALKYDGQIPDRPKGIEETEHNKISESFTLKLIALAMNKEKIKDIE